MSTFPRNEAGEPLMDAAAYRFEQMLDDREPEYDPDAYLAWDDEPDDVEDMTEEQLAAYEAELAMQDAHHEAVRQVVAERDAFVAAEDYYDAREGQ